MRKKSKIANSSWWILGIVGLFFGLIKADGKNIIWLFIGVLNGLFWGWVLGKLLDNIINSIFYKKNKSTPETISLRKKTKNKIGKSQSGNIYNPTTRLKESETGIKPKANSTKLEQTEQSKKNENLPIPDKIIEIVKPEKEEQSKEKYIGYNPINIFAQSEPLNYPYVIMPKRHSVIKFPRKGRTGRKGYKEEDFKKYIEKYFKIDFQVHDDRFILIKNSPKPFEPDFTLIDEKNGINIFLDVEIDEPYEGLNDISIRKPTHFQQADINRNNAFKNRGWIIIRFAEIQVHQEPHSCCRFIADVLKSINPKYLILDSLTNSEKIKPVRQWTKEEAEKWSNEKYREKYLGINSFGITLSTEENIGIEETELGVKIEELIVDDKFIPIPAKTKTPSAKLEKIYSAINSNKYLSINVGNEKTIIKPKRVLDDKLIALCYVKNRERTFSIYGISKLEIKDSFYTLRVAGPTIGIDQITNAINTAITYHKHIRMKYTRSSWTNMFVDEETGELLVDNIEAEESIRTINDVQLSINALAQEEIVTYRLNDNYITAYCNKREEQRTFRFDRIGEIEILNL